MGLLNAFLLTLSIVGIIGIWIIAGLVIYLLISELRKGIK